MAQDARLEERNERFARTLERTYTATLAMTNTTSRPFWTELTHFHGPLTVVGISVP
jgi:hypothetical protein